MTAETIEIRRDCLAAPLRSDLIGIESVMLWPKDIKSRTEAEQAAVVAAGFEMAKGLNLGSDVLLELVGAAANAIPLREIHKWTTVTNGGPFVQGLIAGEILFQSTSRTATNSPDASMKRIVADVSKMYSAIWLVKPKTIENTVWPQYRSVAHLWAAHRHIVYEQLAAHGNSAAYPFPCSAANLSYFLAVAEEFRRLGETTKTKQAPGTVLRANESVRLPADLPLPKGELRFGAASAA
jgi:hypothetical protein